tara:strand:+ start:393 stop:584 length:192 start_codon:yes stop_codon:yes gene_type:complete
MSNAEIMLKTRNLFGEIIDITSNINTKISMSEGGVGNKDSVLIDLLRMVHLRDNTKWHDRFKK